MNKSLFRILLALPLMGIFTGFALHDKKTLMGAIQFPKSLSSIPGIRVYCGGQKLTTEIDNEGKKVVFTLSCERNQSLFYMIITEQLQLALAEDNTINHLKLAAGASYKLFAVQQRADHSWLVQEKRLSLTDSRIPDNSIILCYDPNYVETLSGGTGLELPKLVLKDNLIQLAGSEKKLLDHAAELMLSTLDFDALHAPSKMAVRQDHRSKTIVAVEL